MLLQKRLALPGGQTSHRKGMARPSASTFPKYFLWRKFRPPDFLAAVGPNYTVHTWKTIIWFITW